MPLSFVCHIEVILLVSAALLEAVQCHAHRRHEPRGRARGGGASAGQLSRPSIFSDDDFFFKYFFIPYDLSPGPTRRPSESLQTFTEDALTEEGDTPHLARHPRDRWRVALVNRKYNERINERQQTSPSDAGTVEFTGGGDVQVAIHPSANMLYKEGLSGDKNPEPAQLHKALNVLPEHVPNTHLSHLLPPPIRSTTPRLLVVDISSQNNELIGQPDRYYWNTQELNAWDMDLYYKNQQALTQFNVLDEEAEESRGPNPTTPALPVAKSSIYAPLPKLHTQQPPTPIASYYSVSPKYFVTFGPPIYMPLPEPASSNVSSKVQVTPSTKQCYWRSKVSDASLAQDTTLEPNFKIIRAIVENRREQHVEDNINFHRQLTPKDDSLNATVTTLLRHTFSTHSHPRSHTKGKVAIHNHKHRNKYAITSTRLRPTSDLITKSKPSMSTSSIPDYDLSVEEVSSDSNRAAPKLESTKTTQTEAIEQRSKRLPPPPVHRPDQVRFFELYDRQDEEELEVKMAIMGLPAVTTNIWSVTTSANKQFPEVQVQMEKYPPKGIEYVTKRVTEQTKMPIYSHKTTTKKVTQPLRSEQAHWKDYPYMAMYIYEPENVHCDAAGISAHWLVTSATCLERHWAAAPGEADGEEAAYVAYCGARWHRPERLNYVKFAVVHPRYHTHAQTRKAAYNIGLVKVGSSMLACSGWRPAVMLSHRFLPDPPGVVCVAVGWGLNHFTALERERGRQPPARPLATLTGPVYPGACLDSGDRNEETTTPPEPGTELTYCMRLPPAPAAAAGRGGGTATGGGGVLLAGGKVAGLRLEERRDFSGAHAQLYSGVWRAAGWVRETAREAPADRSGDLLLLEV